MIYMFYMDKSKRSATSRSSSTWRRVAFLRSSRMRPGVRVTAFCPNPDGEGIVLRVWEQAGKGGEITVTLPQGMKATVAQPVNLRGEGEGCPIPVKDGKFSFELNAWAPRSFTLDG